MASVTQALFSLPAFRERYHPTAAAHWQSCSEPLPAVCIDCQMHKLADGLLSGRYAQPHSPGTPSLVDQNPLAHPSPTPIFQEGIKPVSFKALIGKGHEEFSTMRQQDSEEFLTHLIKVLRQHAKKLGHDPLREPTEVFRFGMEQRLQCGECKRVRYRVDSQDVVSVPVPAREKGKDVEGKVLYEDVKLVETLEMLTGDEALEYYCPACDKKVIATKSERLSSSIFFPFLIIPIQTITLLNLPRESCCTRKEVPVGQLGAFEARYDFPSLMRFEGQLKQLCLKIFLWSFLHQTCSPSISILERACNPGKRSCRKTHQVRKFF